MKNRPRRVRAREWYWLRLICTAVLTIVLVASWPSLELLTSAFGPAQSDWPARQSKDVQRIRIYIRKTVELTFDEAIVAAIVIDPDIVAATIQNDRVLLLSGLRVGHTILIISGRTRQATYALDVAPASTSARTAARKLRQSDEQLQPFSGSHGFYFTPGNRDGPPLLRHTFDFTQQLQDKRTLRASGELFRFFGDRERRLSVPLATVFGANRLMFGLDSQTTRLDLLDSQLGSSRLGFNGYTLRGLHFLSTTNSRWRGVEFFAGTARPQLASLSRGEGRLAGMNVPVWNGSRVGIQVGGVWIAPSRRPLSLLTSSDPRAERALLWQAGWRYSPHESTRLSGELAYSKQRVSWSSRLDLQRGPFMFSGEVLHLSRNSPLIAIGAQAEGRTSSTVNFQWTPATRFNAVANYTRTTASSSAGSTRAALNNRLLLVRANFQPYRNTHFSFAFKDQFINLPSSALIPFGLNLESGSFIVKWNQRLSRNWINNLEAHVTSSREGNTSFQTNRGLTVREQLRYHWRGGSAEGFINFRSNTPSLEGLILRNPALLPVDLRTTFAADPRGFLLRNRDVLPILFSEIALPATRETASGANVQASFGRISLMSEAVYSSGVFAAAPRQNLQVSVSGVLRLDAANSIQTSVSRLFAFSGGGMQTALTIGYVHRFGSGSGGGFQFSKLFGVRRGRIQGRVFMDLNNNDRQDSNENGITGITIQLNGSTTATTDARGDFKFQSLAPGEHELTLISSALGVTLRAGNSMFQRISLSSRETVTLSLGLTNTGSIAGRVFNDLLLRGQHTAGDAPGLTAVSVRLYKVDESSSAPNEQRHFNQSTNANGDYQFRNLAPGKYVVQVDPNTLPENFNVPSKTSWDFTVAPLQNLYLDLPFTAQRAISGVVYIDVDGNERFDPGKDSVVAGARVVVGNVAAVSNRDGLYLLRNLPAGLLRVEAYSPAGKLLAQVRVQLGPEPALLTSVNLKIRSELSP